MSKEVSSLGPIDPASLQDESHDESEKSAPWIVRKLVGVSRHLCAVRGVSDGAARA
jgi:hypothetical protein